MIASNVIRAKKNRNQLLRLVREAVGVKQLHQLPPELTHLGRFAGGEFLLLRQRRRRLRIFLLLLRARLPVFLRDLPGLFLALPHERPAAAGHQLLPKVALLIDLANSLGA